MVDIVEANNPSQNGGPGTESGSIMCRPVNGDVAPSAKVEGAPAAVDQNDPVAVAKAAYDAALAAAGKPAEQPAVATPAAPDQPQVEAVGSETGADGMVVYDATGDAGLDFSLAFIGSLGIEGTDPAMVAAANGDFSFIEAKLAALGDKAKGWEQHIALGKQAYGRQLEVFKAEQAKTNTAVHAAVGGEEQWKTIVTWAGTAATKEEKDALNAMFDAGPIQAQMAARALAAAYAEAKGTTLKPANPAQAASGVAPAQPQAMTTASYYKEVDALYRTMGNRMDGSPEYAAIKQKYFGR